MTERRQLVEVDLLEKLSSVERNRVLLARAGYDLLQVVDSDPVLPRILTSRCHSLTLCARLKPFLPTDCPSERAQDTRDYPRSWPYGSGALPEFGRP